VNINEAFPSKYLKASDLQGAEPVVTIDRVELEPIGRDKEMKAVLYFRGKDKGLVLNKTNATKITQLLGSGVTEEWDGQRIRLYATETQFGADLVDCIRIKAATNGKPAAKPAPKPVEEEYSDESEPPF
jgi:hypothetical protein